MSVIRNSLALLFALFAALLIGCGGGGGGGGGSTSGSFPSGSRIEAVRTSNPALVVDLLNIQVGDQISLQAVNYQTDGTRVVQSGATFASSDASNSFGTLSSDGSYTAAAPSGAAAPIFTATRAGSALTANYKVLPVQALLSGRVVVEGSSFGIPGVRIYFYNASNSVVGQVRTAYDGRFTASLPPTAITMQLDATTIDPAAFYRQYTYNGRRYSPLIATCVAPLPGMSVGGSYTLVTNIAIPQISGIPPPPPDGCG